MKGTGRVYFDNISYDGVDTVLPEEKLRRSQSGTNNIAIGSQAAPVSGQ